MNIVQTDDLPRLRVQIVDQATQIPVNLGGQTVTGSIRIREYGQDESLFDADLEKLDGGIYGWMVVDEWPAGAFNLLETGLYEAQVTVVFAASQQTLLRTIRLRVHEKFGAPPA